MDTTILTNHHSTNPVLDALRLGWITVEVFGLLKRYVEKGHQPSASSPAMINSLRRFTFSDRDLMLGDQLLVALQQLEELASRLVPGNPPPVPEPVEAFLNRATNDGNVLWNVFEDWSRATWNILQVRDPLAGRAFTYGGSLADTYWYARITGAEQLGELLRAQRLENIASRFDTLAPYLPDHAAQVIHYTLNCWRMDDQVKALNAEEQKRLLNRLEAQAKVWHDLLFGLQNAESYLQESDRRSITWGAFLATAGLVVLVGVTVWLAVLLLSGIGRTLLASTPGVASQLSAAGASLSDKLLDWQTWSALLATLSSVVVVLTGFITRLSGWMITFHRGVRERLALRYMCRRSLRE